MTSAPNPPPPLSGSKFILALACAALTASSCDFFERLQGGSPKMPPDREANRPTPGRHDAPKEGPAVTVVDSFDLGDSVALDPFAEAALRDRDLPVGPDGAVVSLLLPFLSNQYRGSLTSLPDDSDWALEYYAGVKLGLEALERRGERVNVHVFDTRGDAGAAQRLIADPDLRNSHAIIGPYLTDVARAVATPAQAGLLPLVIPFSASTNIAQAYPRLVQLNPSLPTHLDAAAAYLTTAFDADQVILVGLPNGAHDGALRYLRQRHAELSSDTARWRTWRLTTADVGLQDLEWEGKFAEDKPTVFVFPEYRNPKLVASFLSQLQIGRGENDATAFGMPQWAEFDVLDPSIMEDLGVLITAGFHVDDENARANRFAEAYVERYGASPSLAAYLGYDHVRYVVPVANRYGRAWVEHLPVVFPEGLASEYRLQPVYAPSRPGDSLRVEGAPAAPTRYENRAVDVLEYRDYEFQGVE